MASADLLKSAKEIKQGGAKKSIVLAMLNPASIGAIPNSCSNKHRPFLSPLLWSLDKTYRYIVGTADIQGKFLIDGRDLLDLDYNEEILKLGKLALPARVDVINKYGFRALCSLVEEVEEAILAEINKFLDGEEDDTDTISRANEIVKRIANLESERTKTNS